MVTILAWDARLQRATEASLSFERHQKKEQSKQWYRPFVSSIAFAAVLISVPIILIVSLEVIQHLSGIHNGFVEVSSQSFYIEGWTNYFPTILLLLLAMMFASLAFTVSLFAQFSKMKGAAWSKHTIDQDLTMQMQLEALATTLRTRQSGAALVTFAALCASVLTIIVSGLYSISSPLEKIDVSFELQDVIDPLLHNGSSGDNQASILLSLVDSLGAGNPEGTLDTIVLPKLKPAAGHAPINLTATSLTIQIPVYRAKLDCMAVPKENTNATWLRTSYTDSSSNEISITANLSMPAHCQYDSVPISNHSYVDFEAGEYGGAQLIAIDNSGFIYSGGVEEQTYHNYTTSPNFDDGPNLFSDAQIGCPTYTFFFAAINSTETALANETVLSLNTTEHSLSNAGINILQCSQKIQSIPADVRYSMPALEPDLLHEPVLHEDKARYLDNGTSGFEAFTFHFVDNFAGYYIPTRSPTNWTTATGEIDTFSKSLMFGPNPKSAKELSGLAPGSEDARYGSAFYNATNLLYSRYMAQFINANLRAPIPSLTAKQAARVGLEYDSINGTVTAPVFQERLETQNIYRVVQHKVPKITLQILLGIMAVCAALAYYLVDMRHTLIREPCSIAGKSSLILGGSLVDLIPDRESSGVFDRKRKRWKRSPFDGMMLKLGWWDGEGQVKDGGEWGEVRYRIDVVKRSEKDAGELENSRR